ncbi:hypothetical protein DB30_06329 [Enhygromyxa salina]|uniref:Uncharacterized protein n=1 Tax=Enhygromyxa salina TaxID=215803 RepID=A0A0C1ZUN0_9BACT|nr:hypothetical protein DB30_06329 [Enhygromyxa salina]
MPERATHVDGEAQHHDRSACRSSLQVARAGFVVYAENRL